MEMKMESSDLIALTADVVSSHVSNNNVANAELPTLIANVYAALLKVAAPAEPEVAKTEPAVPIRSSVKHDYIVCLEDGKKLKMLKRYLRTNYGMTPEDYRSKWNLPRDYPMVAPAYAEQRRGLAKSIGLGRKKAPVAALSTIQPAIIATDAPKIPVKRGRPAKAKIAPAAAPKPKAPKKMKTDAPAA
jgi:predicted transcriptional regulator